MHALRGVAQPGRASALGAECRQFESGYPDTKKDPLRVLFRIIDSQFDKIRQCLNGEKTNGGFCAARVRAARRVRATRRSRIGARTLKPSRAKRTQPVLSLDLSEAQASPKGKTRNEMRVLAIWLPRTISKQKNLRNTSVTEIFVVWGICP